jgi:methionyl-tRNA synthetase
MTPFFVTTPIYYINARPHIGHAYTTMLADAVDNDLRLKVLENVDLIERAVKIRAKYAKKG